MPDFLTTAFQPSAPAAPLDIALRLATALLLGAIVAWIYRRARGPAAASGSFPTTLVLLCTLIAMVTQVIGDNVARAFSLVGALSIVRFRTVVRDTQDTAYVIFAVAVGMAVGAQAPWVALIGLVVVGVTAFLLRKRENVSAVAQSPFLLHIRVPLGYDLEKLRAPIDSSIEGCELLSIETAKQGAALDVSYEVRLKRDASPNGLVRDLNKTEGVQSVELQKRSEAE